MDLEFVLILIAVVILAGFAIQRFYVIKESSLVGTIALLTDLQMDALALTEDPKTIVRIERVQATNAKRADLTIIAAGGYYSWIVTEDDLRHPTKLSAQVKKEFRELLAKNAH